jgi:ketosteroid isomerase-like protein
MRFPLPLLVLLLAGCAGGARSTGSASAGLRPVTADSAALAAASEIMRLEEAWGRALSKRDTAFFRQILADDFVGTGGADVQSKASVIDQLARGSGTVPPPRFEQAQVRLFGEVALVTGVAAYPGPTGAPTSRTRFTEVWVKRAGRWQAVHGHYNALPPQTQ